MSAGHPRAASSPATAPLHVQHACALASGSLHGAIRRDHDPPVAVRSSPAKTGPGSDVSGLS
eukprot:10486735-Alexandrium_andersonii.AAC.1